MWKKHEGLKININDYEMWSLLLLLKIKYNNWRFESQSGLTKNWLFHKNGLKIPHYEIRNIFDFLNFSQLLKLIFMVLWH